MAKKISNTNNGKAEPKVITHTHERNGKQQHDSWINGGHVDVNNIEGFYSFQNIADEDLEEVYKLINKLRK